MGARAHGMGWSSECISDVWAMTNNIAGLAQIEHATAAFSYHSIPSFKSFNRAAAVFALPLRAGVAGAAVFRFGDDLYNEQLASLGFANTFGLASLGLRLNYIQYNATGFGAYHAFTVSIGGLARLTPHLSFGAHIANVNQPVINGRTEERLPTKLSAGLAFKESTKLTVATEVEKDIDHSPTLRSGIEYWILKKVAFRTGFNLHPEAGFFGAGFKSRRFNLDYAVQFNDVFGMSHEATVVYEFGNR